MDEAYNFYIAYRNRDGDTLYDTHYYPPAAVLWYPTSQWEPGESTLIQTLPWALDAEQFALMVGVYAGESGWVEANRLPITKYDADRELAHAVLENGSLIRLDTFERTRSGDWQRTCAGDNSAAPPPASTLRRGYRAGWCYVASNKDEQAFE